MQKALQKSKICLITGLFLSKIKNVSGAKKKFTLLSAMSQCPPVPDISSVSCRSASKTAYKNN